MTTNFKFKKIKSTRDYFREAYRLVRQPDMYLAQDTDGVLRFKTDIPLGIFKLAESCLESRLNEKNNFKN